MVVDHIHTDTEEVDEHQFSDGAHPLGSGTNRCTNEGRLRNRCINDALLPELREEPLGGTEDAAILCNILTKHKDLGVALHLLGDRLRNSGGHSELAGSRHRDAPLSSLYKYVA